VGLLFAALKDLEILQDTLIYVIVGDNGASAEGSFNEMVTLMGFAHLERQQWLPSQRTR
jgi:arylsulfatase